tara:strand:- start:462 stop:791 length:330 start_codon:yes stop_codon:yes gene_type:complete
MVDRISKHYVQSILKKHPNKVPLVIHHDKNKKKLHKFIIPSDSSIMDLLYIVRKRVNLDSEQALYIYVNAPNGKSNLLPTNLILSSVYEENKLDNGLLHLIYAEENVFG